jgi:hypothetical protein
MVDKMPSPESYYLAIQNPQVCLADTALKNARAKRDPMDMPVVRSGNFASTYQLEAPPNSWALRCFLRPSSDQQQRYAAISRFITGQRRTYLLSVEYQQRGILVDGKWWPVVKMPWARDAVTMGTYVNRYCTDVQKLMALRDAIAAIGSDLQKINAAHGDLQMGNIMVGNSGAPVLVDYDGFYVPGMGDIGSAERGHPNFQHPYRDRQFDATLDRFSLLVLYVGFSVMNSARWKHFGSGENLLFTGADFSDPNRSALFNELLADPTARKLAGQLAEVAKGSWADIPTLDEFLTGGQRVSSPPSWPRPEPTRLYDVIAATDTDTLLKRFGEKVEVVGWITSMSPLGMKSAVGEPFLHFNFGDWWKGAFGAVLWSEALDAFSTAGRDVKEFRDQWVSVVGVLGKYEYASPAWKPQISIDSPADIRILSAPEAEKLLAAPQPEQLLQQQSVPLRPAVLPPATRLQSRETPQPKKNEDQKSEGEWWRGHPQPTPGPRSVPANLQPQSLNPVVKPTIGAAGPEHQAPKKPSVQPVQKVLIPTSAAGSATNANQAPSVTTSVAAPGAVRLPSPQPVATGPTGESRSPVARPTTGSGASHSAPDRLHAPMPVELPRGLPLVVKRLIVGLLGCLAVLVIVSIITSAMGVSDAGTGVNDTTGPVIRGTMPAAVNTPVPSPASSGSSKPIDAFHCPATHPLKGNQNTMIYHRPGGFFYGKTKPEVCFATDYDATAAGYRASKR